MGVFRVVFVGGVAVAVSHDVILAIMSSKLFVSSAVFLALVVAVSIYALILS